LVLLPSVPIAAASVLPRQLAWALAAVLAVALALCLRAGRVPTGRKGYDRQSDPGFFWFAITVQALAVLILVWSGFMS